MMTTVQLLSCGTPISPREALADSTVHFPNGGTAEMSLDGYMRGMAYVGEWDDPLASHFAVVLPDGTQTFGDCIDHNHWAPAPGYYPFLATPEGPGKYSVLIDSSTAERSPRQMEGVFLDPPQRVGCIVWIPQIMGKLTVRKSSSDTGLSGDNDMYSLAGARFSIWSDEACTVPAVDGAVLETGDDALAGPLELAPGTYWLKEETAPPGFAPMDGPCVVEVESGKIATAEIADEPIVDRPEVLVTKHDAQVSLPQGAGTLESAEFAISYYDGQYDERALPQTPTRTWVMRTDAQGDVRLSTDSMVWGDSLYYDAQGAPVFPLGTYAIREVRAPEGYYLEGQGPSSPADYVAPLHMAYVTGVGSYGSHEVLEAIKRGGLSLQKVDAQTGMTAQGDANLAGVTFEVVSLNQQEVVVNGSAYSMGEPVGVTLVTDARGFAQTANDALPVGTYEVRETGTNDSLRLTAEAQRVTIDAASSNTVVEVGSAFANEVKRGGVRLAKLDADLRRSQGQGDATLAGVQFSVYLESDLPVMVEGRTYSKGQVVTTLTTDESGVAQTAPNALPYGTYSIREARAPEGYHTNASYRQTFAIREDGVIVDLTEHSCIDQVMRGGVCLGKVDADLSADTPQGDATLEGAEFSITLESPNPVVVDGTEYSTGQVVARLYTDASGVAFTGDHALPYGTYHIHETMPPEGYQINKSFSRSFVIREEGLVVDLGQDKCRDEVVRAGLVVGKVSRETLGHYPQGEASLRGARFEVTLTSERPVVVHGKTISMGEVACSIVTDERGIAQTDDQALPYGSYEVREVEPPDGFLPNAAWVKSVNVREQGVMYDLSAEVDSVDDQVKRGGFRLNKVDEDTMERLGGTAFRITSQSTGENHVCVADENGILDTEMYPHSVLPNANDNAVDDNGAIVEQLITPTAGLWFSGGPDLLVEPNNDMPALPYDTYLVEELRSKSNVGRALVSFIVRVHEHGQHIDMGTVDDKPDHREPPEPLIGTTLAYDGTEHVAPVSERVVLTDVIRYENLVPGEGYDVLGRLMDKETGEPVRVGDEEVTASTSFTPTTSAGSLDLSFVLDASDLAGRTVVAFEQVSNEDGMVASHEDLEDVGQTIQFPDLGTQLTDEEGNHEVLSDGRLRLVDVVSYCNLQPGRSYEVRGVLVDKDSEAPLVDEDGREVWSTTSFVPEGSDGEVEVTFLFDAGLARGKTLVAFETLLRAGIPLVAHEDLDDEGQTVRAPDIQTELTDASESHVVTAEGPITLTDSVTYKNLTPHKEYTLVGTLMDRESGEELADAEGAPIEASTTFIPEEPDGIAQVSFEFEGSAARGRTVVAFERVQQDGRDVAVHADLEDDAQTVWVPQIGTTFDGVGETHEAPALAQLELVDRVAYLGLAPGVPYTLMGTLMDAASGEELRDSHGTTIQAIVTFVPQASEGTVDVPFSFDARDLAGKTLVAFETLFEGETSGGRKLAEHADISDQGQTVSIPGIQTTACDAEDGDGYLCGVGSCHIQDEVQCTNLQPGTTYVMRGTLHDKGTGAIVVDSEGMPIVSQKEFVAEERNMHVTLDFEVDASLVPGSSVVVFESCMRDDREVAVHADLMDESQTVRKARMRTTATDEQGIEHEIQAIKDACIVDTIRYEGLAPEVEYQVVGTLMDQQTGMPVKAEGDKPVQAASTFTPHGPNGTVAVNLVFDASKLAGHTVVVFERLTAAGKLVANHEDLTDRAQSVFVREAPAPEEPKREEEPKPAEEPKEEPREEPKPAEKPKEEPKTEEKPEETQKEQPEERHEQKTEERATKEETKTTDKPASNTGGGATATASTSSKAPSNTSSGTSKAAKSTKDETPHTADTLVSPIAVAALAVLVLCLSRIGRAT